MNYRWDKILVMVVTLQVFFLLGVIKGLIGRLDLFAVAAALFVALSAYKIISNEIPKN